MKKLYSIKTLDELADHFQRYEADARAASKRAKPGSRTERTAYAAAQVWKQAELVVRQTEMDYRHAEDFAKVGE